MNEQHGDEQALIDFLWHEVQRPVSALSLCIQSALRRSRSMHGPPEVNERLAAAEWQCQTLIRMLGRLRTAMDPHGHPLCAEPSDLEDLLRHIASAMAEQFEHWGVSLEVETEPLPGMWDPVAVSGLVQNLLANAAHHGRGANVRVRLKRDRDFAVIEIHDEGPGIPAEDQERIFDAGVRGRQSHGVGLGLGLSIVRAIALAHQGTVSVHSRPGEGTTFAVRLPVVEAEAPERAPLLEVARVA